MNLRSVVIVLVLVLIGVSTSCSPDDESHKYSLFPTPNTKTFELPLPSFLYDEKSPFLNTEHIEYNNFKSFSDLHNQLKDDYDQTLELLSQILAKKPLRLPSYNKIDTLWAWNYNLDFKEKQYNVLLELKQKTQNLWEIKINNNDNEKYQTISKGSSNTNNTVGQWECTTSTLLGAKEATSFITINWEITAFNDITKQVFTLTDTKSSLYNNIYTFTATALGNYTHHINLKKTENDAPVQLDLLYNSTDSQGHIQKTVGEQIDRYCWDTNYEPIDCIVTSLTTTTE